MEQASEAAKVLQNSELKKKVKQPKQVAYVPKQGYVWNPFRKWPANLTCFCGSGRKFKKCHMHVIPQAIPKAQEREVKEYVERNIKYIQLLKSKGIVYKVEEKKQEANSGGASTAPTQTEAQVQAQGEAGKTEKSGERVPTEHQPQSPADQTT